MKRESGLFYRFCLAIGDTIAFVIAFLFAYFFRIYIDTRPFFFEVNPASLILPLLLFIPLWLIILYTLGLYRNDVIKGRSHSSEIGRLALASFIGIMTLITYDFFVNADLFRTRTVAIYAVILCFLLLVAIRNLVHFLRYLRFSKSSKNALGVILIGDNENASRLIKHIETFPEDGYRLVAIIGKPKHLPKNLRGLCYASLDYVLKTTSADVIFQTDEKEIETVYQKSLDYHLPYYYIPSEAALSSHFGEVELIGTTPAILIKVTPLIGGSSVAKRLMDLILGGLLTLIALIPMLIIFLIEKLSDPKHSAIYVSERLSRHGKKVKIYKFRSMKAEYSGMSPEAAFKKMRRPELIEKYRAGGDCIEDDPRITKLGKFLRATSLDELPQLFNVLKGDISLVGPRALVPGELKDYGERSLLLSVKSGLTGLAQVSGRRDLSFEERRSLDLYYIQNWSFALDIQIIFRTIGAVLFRKGAK